MRIDELLAQGLPSFSFEFFPPRSEEAEDRLKNTIADLRSVGPNFVSVTCRSGDDARRRTINLVAQLKRTTGIDAMAHLTCSGSTRDELLEDLHLLREAGVENVLALRGDPADGEDVFRPVKDGFAYASDLVALIAEEFGTDPPDGFCIGGAFYPEGHPEALGIERDIDNLSKKVDAGASFLIGQLFFDNSLYFDFVERARKAGITVPLLPGIMPITNVDQIERFTLMCGASILPALRLELDRRRDDPAAVMQLGVAHATAQAVGLLNGGAPGIHFYTLNKSIATRAILVAIRGAVSL